LWWVPRKFLESKPLNIFGFNWDGVLRSVQVRELDRSRRMVNNLRYWKIE
jgi:hypothetical protein